MDSLFSTKYIMRTTFYIIIFFLAGCTSKSQKGLDSELPILDLSQNYPESARRRYPDRSKPKALFHGALAAVYILFERLYGQTNETPVPP